MESASIRPLGPRARVDPGHRPAAASERFAARTSLAYPDLVAHLEREVARVAAERQRGVFSDDPHDDFLALNLQRMRRVEKTFRPPRPLLEAMAAIVEPQAWWVISETWCGDSAQTAGIFAAAAALADGSTVNLRFLGRDANPDLMDLYVGADGKRNIPLLVAFDPKGRELFRWGPRPRPARDLFRAAQAEGLAKPAILERLHAWYARDRGVAVAEELAALVLGAVRAAGGGAPDLAGHLAPALAGAAG